MLSASPSPADIGAQFLPELSTASPPGYDPNRIPASVFSTKASNPADWSVASNESLFSIHMGKSGELPRLDECSNESSILPPVIEHEESSLISRQDSSSSVAVNNNHWTTMEDHVNEKMGPADAANARDFKRAPPAETTLNSSSTPRTSTSNPRLSDESGNSSSSFAFPVLVSDGGVKTNSLKGVVTDNPDKNLQLQAQVSKATSKAPKRRRCCWFCCWPRCC
ncbi:hypothetical protein DH2020_037120 [Rehmannia glutinosa]|uniref:Uncharacterized protein n=1 Tax=Rehmannia glutinosa TaxID=99300 RepID=A0ABR0V2W3_REHGL